MYETKRKVEIERNDRYDGVEWKRYNVREKKKDTRCEREREKHIEVQLAWYRTRKIAIR